MVDYAALFLLTVAPWRGNTRFSQDRQPSAILMSKPELGTKRDCPECGARFYDLTKEPAHCPKCDNEFVPESLLKPRKTRAEEESDGKAKDEEKKPEQETSLESADEEKKGAKSKRAAALDEESDDDSEDDDELGALGDLDLDDDDDDDDEDTSGLLVDDDDDDDVSSIVKTGGDDDD